VTPDTKDAVELRGRVKQKKRPERPTLFYRSDKSNKNLNTPKK
jgi:hypothetical protein